MRNHVIRASMMTLALLPFEILRSPRAAFGQDQDSSQVTADRSQHKRWNLLFCAG